VRFQWRGERATPAALTGYRLRIFAPDRAASDAAFQVVVGPTNRLVLDLAAQSALAAGGDWLWRVESLGPAGESWPDAPPARFTIDPDAPPQALTPEPRLGPNGEIIAHSLRRDVAPAFGELKASTATARDEDGTLLDGRDQRVVYAVPVWPEDAFTVQVNVQITEFPTNRIGQIFSAWCAPMDDPLRLVVDGGKVFARLEAGAGFSTPGVPILANEWHQVTAVKQGDTLTLYLDGKCVGSCPAPEFSVTQARDCALGGNPHYSGNECLAARFADFQFLARALSAEAIAKSTGAR
jgi:hypothetical protein